MAAREILMVCTPGMSFALPPGATVLLKRAVGTRIVCREGTLWMSEYRRPEDQVLGPGQSALVLSDRAIVLSGLPRAQVELRCSPELSS